MSTNPDNRAHFDAVEIVKRFKLGLSVSELAEGDGIAELAVESIIRLALVTQPEDED